MVELMSVKPWADDEVSSRNCYNCLCPRQGIYVECRKGHPMLGIKEGSVQPPLTFNGVVRLPRLFMCCQGCPDFDNDW